MALRIHGESKIEQQERKLIKPGIITDTDPETLFNALRLAQYALKEGDNVRIFLSGRGVEFLNGESEGQTVWTTLTHDQNRDAITAVR